MRCEGVYHLLKMLTLSRSFLVSPLHPSSEYFKLISSLIISLYLSLGLLYPSLQAQLTLLARAMREAGGHTPASLKGAGMEGGGGGGEVPAEAQQRFIG